MEAQPTRGDVFEIPGRLEEREDLAHGAGNQLALPKMGTAGRSRQRDRFRVRVCALICAWSWGHGSQVPAERSSETRREARSSARVAASVARGSRQWSDRDVRCPEEFSADEHVPLMAVYEFPGGFLEMESEYKTAVDRGTLLVPAATRDCAA